MLGYDATDCFVLCIPTCKLVGENTLDHGIIYKETAGTGESAAPAVEVASIAVCYCAPKILVNFSSIALEFSLM